MAREKIDPDLIDNACHWTRFRYQYLNFGPCPLPYSQVYINLPLGEATHYFNVRVGDARVLYDGGQSFETLVQASSQPARGRNMTVEELWDQPDVLVIE